MYVEDHVRGKIDDGFLTSMWGTLQNLTDFRNERDKLIQSTELVQRILNAVPDAIFVANGSGVITAVILQRNLDAYAKGTSNPSMNQPKGGTDTLTDNPVVGVTESSAKFLNVGQRAISIGSRVLPLGESGVGKTEFSELLHRRSGRETDAPIGGHRFRTRERIRWW